jgi:hypothetical protein
VNLGYEHTLAAVADDVHAEPGILAITLAIKLARLPLTVTVVLRLLLATGLILRGLRPVGFPLAALPLPRASFVPLGLLAALAILLILLIALTLLILLLALTFLLFTLPFLLFTLALLFVALAILLIAVAVLLITIGITVAVRLLRLLLSILIAVTLVLLVLSRGDAGKGEHHCQAGC